MCLTEGRAAIHTPRRLDFTFDARVLLLVPAIDGVQLLPVQHTAGGITIRFLVASVVDESAELFNGLVGAVATFHFGFVVVIVDALAPDFVTTVGTYGTTSSRGIG